MARPWETVDSVPTPDGELELRRRGDAEFLILIDRRVLMTSVARRSEEALGSLGCAHLHGVTAPRVFIGGLGMGFTLRAALDALPQKARVVVVELNPTVVDWCRGPLADLTKCAISDPRVEVRIGDASKVIASSPEAAFDAILLDLFEGPHAATQSRDDPFYGPAALVRTQRALSRNGAFVVWSEEADEAFARRLAAAGFSFTTHRAGKGGRSHVVYLARR